MAAPSTPFDATKYKNAQRDQWDKDAAAWWRWQPTLDRCYGDATRQMLDMARIAPGQHVLDVAAGVGEPAASAARRVGSGGRVLATDISEQSVRLALQVARERGLMQIDTRCMDGEALDLADATFDAVICRFGLMYMPHPVAALTQWRRVLKDAGRVAVAVFSTPQRNAWGATPAAIIRRRAGLEPPAAGQPGPFGLGAPGVLEGVLRSAGFGAPELRAVQVPLRISSAAEYVRLASEAFGAFNAMMAHLAARERDAAWAEIEASMREFETPAGFEVPGECLVCSAVK